MAEGKHMHAKFFGGDETIDLDATNGLIQRLCACTENKIPSGRVMNEIRDINEQLKVLSKIEERSGETLFDVFLNYNILLAEDLCSPNSVNICRLEKSIISHSLFLRSTKPVNWRDDSTVIYKANLKIANECQYFLMNSSLDNIHANILPIWLLASLMMKLNHFNVALCVLKNSLCKIQVHSNLIKPLFVNVLSNNYYLISLASLGIGDIANAKRFILASISYNPQSQKSISLLTYIVAAFGGTISDAKSCIGLAKGNSSAALSLGYTMSKKGYFQEAIAQFRHSLEIGSIYDMYSMYNLAIVYGRTGDIRTMKKILHLLSESLMLHQTKSSSNYHPSKSNVLPKQTLNAEDQLSKHAFSTITINNSNSNISSYSTLIYNMSKYMLGRIHAIDGNWIGACIEYSHVCLGGVNILPSTEFHCNYASALLRSNKVTEAMNLLNPIFRIDPYNPDIGEIMVEIYIALNELEEALITIENILNNYHKLSIEKQYRLYNNKAMLLTCAGKYVEAIDSINRAIAVSKESVLELLFNRTFLYIRIGNLKEAAVTWLKHRDINVEGDKNYYRKQLTRLTPLSNRFEGSTKMFCDGQIDFKQLISMDIFACNTLLQQL